MASPVRPRSFALPLDTPPMEARTAAELPATGGPWQYEPKWDGFRCLAFKSRRAVELRAKSGKPLGRYFPEIVSHLASLTSTGFVLDGELVIELDRRWSFEALQLRLHPAESRIRKLSAQSPARLMAFDILASRNGAPMLREPLVRRRRALEELIGGLGPSPFLALSPATGELRRARRWLRGAGRGATDGVIAKRLDEPYRPGERSMVKVKLLRTADCVVGGFRYASGAREVGSLLLGLYDAAGRLDHVGFTSGIPASERRALTRRLEQLRAEPGFSGRKPGAPSRWGGERSAQWQPLRPELVVEVQFDHVSDDRFRHGTRLMRWRPDKAPRQCTLEQLRVARAGAGQRAR
jgi:ATP-dependent DNA ligase